jgi:hypothetical protein
MFTRFSGLSRQRLKEENIRRSKKAAIPVGDAMEKPVGVEAYRKKRRESAKRADKAVDAATRRILQGGAVRSR